MIASFTEKPDTHVADLVPGYDNVTEVAMFRHYDILFINGGTLYTYLFRNPNGSKNMTVDKTEFNGVKKIRVNRNSIAILYENEQLYCYSLKRDDYGPLQISDEKFIAEKVITMGFFGNNNLYYVGNSGSVYAYINGNTINTQVTTDQPYFYPFDLVTYSPHRHEGEVQPESDQIKKAKITAMSLVTTHNPFIKVGVDDILADVLSFGVDHK